MKLKLSLALSLAMSCGLGSMVAQPAAAPAAPAPAEAAKKTFTNEELATELGWYLGQRFSLAQLDFSKTELDALVKGMMAAAAGKEAPIAIEEAGPQMDQFMRGKQAAYVQKAAAKASEESAAFFTKLRENKAVVFLPSGLAYEMVKVGDGPEPTAKDTVKVHYTGTLIDGSVFDSSVRNGGQPVELQLSQVIQGWTEGITKMKKGGKIKLYIPEQLGYGNQAQEGIPPGSTLIFEVELLDINPAASSAVMLPPAK